MLRLAPIAAAIAAFAGSLLATPPAGALALAAPDAGPAFVPRLVVKLDAAVAAPRAQRADRVAAQIAELSRASGVPLVHVRTMAIGAQVLTSPLIGNGADADFVAAKIATLPGVAWATRTRPLHAERVPNDPLYSSQFYLHPGAASIDAQSAWDLTTGSPAVVVAVLDTGSTPHADLAGRMLPGYDFVASALLSNDGSPLNAAGNYRDNDAEDPGDWVTPADIKGPLEENECTPRDSSWHGTSVLGAIGARSDNGLYLTGVDWNASLLPVRVLGKCYGDDADVADAVAWAGGVAVPTVPLNAHPAHVINMSLGDPGTCQPFFQESIDAAFAHGITRAIVVSAGNDANADSHTPSDCTGVLAIAASTVAGNRAAYSNYGPRIDLAAPGGNGNGAASSNFLALFNTGATGQGIDTTRGRAGTSFAAPLVSGVAALMLSVAPTLTAAEVREIIKASAKPFAPGSSCAGVCGAGILDAPGAVRMALAATDRGVPVTLVEYYNASLDHYFITWNATEIALLDAGTTLRGWTRTGKVVTALMSAAAGTSRVCRIYIPPGQGDGHYFGRDATECDGTLARHPSFVLESPAFFNLYLPTAGACQAGTIPVYRVFSNRADANHRYTTERAVRDAMVAKGWLAEGDGPDAIVMCAPQ